MSGNIILSHWKPLPGATAARYSAAGIAIILRIAELTRFALTGVR